MMFADVILPLAVEARYTYLIPTEMENKVERGMLVHVAFAGDKIYTGLVYNVHADKPENIEVKPLLAIVDEQMILTDKQLRLIDWISAYYMCCRGEVIKAALPTLFRLESYSAVTKLESDLPLASLPAIEQRILGLLQLGQYQSVDELQRLTELKNIMTPIRSLIKKEVVAIKENMNAIYVGKQQRWLTRGSVLDADDMMLNFLFKRSVVQQRIVAALLDCDFKEMERTAFIKRFQCTSAIINTLVEKGVLIAEDRIVDSFEHCADDCGEMPVLSEIQDQAYREITDAFVDKDCVLLHGVTSSGKTEIYIKQIEYFIQQGKQVLYLLPEIALTIQIVKRLRRAFGDCIGVYHSGMTDKLRADMWRKQLSENPYKIILGVRSSVFLPFTNLGFIIVDEEHENSFKQSDPAPRYNGRDVALVLASFFNAKVLLGSATPSFESYKNAQDGKYGYVLLDKRHNNIELPEIMVADMTEYRRKKLLKGSLSPMLVEQMTDALGQGNQVLLFQNRRGYSSFVLCDKCGAVPKCKHCDVSMTYYKQRSILSCHYCGRLESMPNRCTACGEGNYKMSIPGTEKIEEEVQQLFPDKVVARMDLEVMNSKRKSHDVIDRFERGEIDILVGTQMIAKGLDFEKVKLVGVIDADSMLNFPDFRAEERAYNLLTQVSGRSGRSGERGKVVIQLSNVEHPLLPYVRTSDYTGLYTLLCEERKLFGYPPFSRLIEMELRGKDVRKLREAANKLGQQLRARYGARVCGPAVPVIGKIHDMFRIHILLKLEPKSPFTQIKQDIKQQVAVILKEKGYGSIRFTTDVDPY
ncbi:MAG: replication restart helicase PriA [Marinifilaceae bacterium]